MIEEAYCQFGEWLQRQPFWIQDAAWRLYNKQEIDEKKIDEYISMCIRQNQKKTCEYMQLSETSILPVLSKTKMAIHSITDVENVNALAENQGVSVHPGSAKNIMKNAITMAYEFQSMLPASECPECTEGYEGFYHAIDITGTSDEVEVKYIIRDHNREKFEKRKETFRKIVAYLNEKYGYEAFLLDMKDSYLNMREYIEKEMHLIDHAVAAMEKLGIQPQISPIRGGTDGAMLTYKGLCCPNLGTGSEGHHGRHEFACVESMDKIVELLIQIVLNYAA